MRGLVTVGEMCGAGAPGFDWGGGLGRWPGAVSLEESVERAQEALNLEACLAFVTGE